MGVCGVRCLQSVGRRRQGEQLCVGAAHGDRATWPGDAQSHQERAQVRMGLEDSSSVCPREGGCTFLKWQRILPDTGKRLQWRTEQIYHLWDPPPWETPSLFVGVQVQRAAGCAQEPPSASPLVLELWGCRRAPKSGIFVQLSPTSGALCPTAPARAHIPPQSPSPAPGRSEGPIQGMLQHRIKIKLSLSWPCSENQETHSQTGAWLLFHSCPLYGQSFHSGS